MPKVSLTYRVPYADTDQMKVVYYANFLTYFERIRNEFFRAIKFPYVNLENQGIMLPVVDVYCKYKQPAVYDDLLTITINLVTVKGCRMRLEYEVLNEEGLLLSTGYTNHAFMCSTSRRPMRPSETFVECIEKWNNPHA